VQLLDRGLDRGFLCSRDLLAPARHALLGIAHFALQAAEFALQIGLDTLQSQQFGLADETAFDQLRLSLDFFCEQPQLLFHADHLQPGTLDPLAQRADALLDCRNLAAQGLTAGLKGELLAFDDRSDIGVLGQCKDGWRKLNLVFLPHLADQPGGHRLKTGEAQFQPPQFSFRSGIVEIDQNLLRFDPIAFPHTDIADDAPLQMLHDLVLAGDDKNPGGHHGPGNRRGSSPDAKAQHRSKQHHRTEQRKHACRTRHAGVPDPFSA